MFFILERRDADGWYQIGSGEFDNAQEAIAVAVASLEVPIEDLRVKTTTEEQASKDILKCEECGGSMVHRNCVFTCEVCGGIYDDS